VRQASSDEPAKTAPHVDHLFELFQSNGRRVLRVSLSKLHGKVHNDGFHGHASWSSDERQFAYVAEAKRAKTSSFFVDGEREADSAAGAEHTFIDDFGEQLGGRALGRLFVVDLTSGAVCQVGADAGSAAAELSLGQAVFSPNGTSLAFTGWSVSPYRLGMLACFNRTSFVFVASLVDASKPVQRVGPPDDCAMHRSPRFTPDGRGLVLLATENRVAHASSSSLWFCDLALPEKLRCVVPIVQQPARVADFPGLYLAQLPLRPWLSAAELVCSSTWFSAQVVVTIDVQSGAVHRVPLPASLPAVVSTDVLDARFDRVLIASSAPTRLPLVFSGAKTAAGWTWTAVSVAASALPQDAWTSALSQCTTTVHQLTAGAATYEYVLLMPPAAANGAKHRCILFPHGGPHVATTVSYASTNAFFLLSGFAVVMPNYRGSTGQGEAALSSLLGRVGENDVDDCLASLVDALNKNAALIDPRAVYMFGGSHGGFLSGHCIARTYAVASEPDVAHRFRSCAMRNPVTNIASMADSTDIGDWCVAESGSTNYATMRACSPIAHIDNVHTPVLLLVGDSDRRVPPAQSIEYFRALRKLGRMVEMKVYAGQMHGLANLASMEADGIVNSLLWFEHH
jgi:acylaminoacyl-peptidase